MTKLKYIAGEMGFTCTNCGAIYDESEIRRLFSYDRITKSNFYCGYCMDCGLLFDDVDLVEWKEE